MSNEPNFVALFTIPFSPKKLLYSPSSEFFKEGNELCKRREKQFAIEIDDEEFLHHSHAEFPCSESGCRATFTKIKDYEIHYANCHRIVCNDCKRTFPSYSLLDLHIREKHDSFFKVASEKMLNSYQCFVEGCSAVFNTLQLRNEHIIKLHNYPPDFKFGDLKLERESTEKMDTECQRDIIKKSSKSRVPSNICFGRGSNRAFSSKSSIYSNKPKKPSVKDITMKELADAL